MPRGILSTQISESSLALSLGSSGSLSATSLDSATDFVNDEDYDSSNETANVDDDALSELIRKLKGQGGTSTTVVKDDAPSVTAAESVSSETVDDTMEDDLIERHLKALAQSTTIKPIKPSKPKVIRNVESEDEDGLESDDDASHYYSEEESLGFSQHQAPTWDEVNGNEEDPVDVYNAAEEMVQKLLGDKSSTTTQDQDVDDNNDHKMFLKSMVESGTKYDYGGAPKTASTQNAWLTKLAKDLLQEDSGSDGESSIEEEHYDKNISNLAKAAANAKQLIESSAKQQKRMEAWRKKHRSKKPEFRARQAKQVLQTSSIEAKLNASTNSPREPAVATNIDHEAHHSGAGASNFNDIDSVFTPVDRIAPADEFTIVPNAAPAFPTFLDPVRPAAEIVVPIIPKKQKTTKIGKKKDLKDIVHAATEHVAAISTTPPEDALLSSPFTHETYVDRVEKIKGSDDGELEPDRKPSQQLVIPEGMPPYPGFGPKWPWHPNSADAPPGYRECYMHHLGDTYYEYMDYLQTRAEHKDDHETSSEKILRHSLRQEAKFKKPKPALSPYTFTARPGKARENCAVGGTKPLPKIEEGSNSSGSRSSETNAFQKKIQQKKTQPDVLTVGKYHTKAKKGRKAKIVVVSGAELDQKAKKMQKSKRKPLQNRSNHSDRSEQPNDRVEQHCMCSIM